MYFLDTTDNHPSITSVSPLLAKGAIDGLEPPWTAVVATAVVLGALATVVELAAVGAGVGVGVGLAGVVVAGVVGVTVGVVAAGGAAAGGGVSTGIEKKMWLDVLCSKITIRPGIWLKVNVKSTLFPFLSLTVIESSLTPRFSHCDLNTSPTTSFPSV